MERYTIKNFRDEYPDDDACLRALFETQYPVANCPECQKGRLHRVRSRPSWACSNCNNHVYPMAGTIFRKSTTPLSDWFYIIYLFSVTKNGLSAKEVQRHLGVTYKTAWRMCTKIRSTMHAGVEEKEREHFRKQFITSVEGTYHYISSKYFQYYLAEFLFRYEHRGRAIAPILLRRVFEHRG